MIKDPHDFDKQRALTWMHWAVMTRAQDIEIETVRKRLAAMDGTYGK